MNNRISRANRGFASLLIAGLVAVAFVAVAAAAQTGVVLGSSKYEAPAGTGWGTAHPAKIFNGGDPSGEVAKIHWKGWGGSTATGVGLAYIYKPAGGFYSKRVHAELRAYDKGHCSAGGPLAYRKLQVREPKKPGGPYGKWEPWGSSKTIC